MTPKACAWPKQGPPRLPFYRRAALHPARGRPEWATLLTTKLATFSERIGKYEHLIYI